jgi:hypothetical protein
MANLSNINGKFVVEQTTGYVGVGTTDPNYPIEVLNASAEIALNASGGSIYRVQSDSASNFIIRKEGVGDRLVINSAGNSTFAGTVTTPQINLHGVGTTYLNIGNATTGTTSSDGASIGFYTGQTSLQIVNRENDAIVLSTNNSPSVTILGNGSVGIGTTLPDAKLHIKGDSDTNSEFLIIEDSDSTAGSITPKIQFKSASAAIGSIRAHDVRGLQLGGGTNTQDLTIDPSGKVGIGTTSLSAKLEVAGNITTPNQDLSSTATPTNFGVYTSEIRLIDTPNGGLKQCRVITDNYGEWILVGRFAASAMNSIANGSSWSSESGLDTGTAQNLATKFSADFGDSYPTEVRIMGATDFTKWRDTRTVDFIYGVPEGRPWKFFFSGGAVNGMTYGGSNMSGNSKFGWSINGSYDGFGRWVNPAQNFVGMSDSNIFNPSAAYTTATANAFNWDTADDAKITVSATRTFSGQDSFVTAGFGNDDNIYGFFDEYPGETTNMGGGVDFSSAAWILIKLPAAISSGSGGGVGNQWTGGPANIYSTNTTYAGIGTSNPRSKLEIYRPAGQSSVPQLTISTGESNSRDWAVGTDVMGGGDLCILQGATVGAAPSSTSANVRMRFTDTTGSKIMFKYDNTTELGTYTSTAFGGSVKRIRMNQGGEIHFGDTTVNAPLGMTEGTWDNFADQDFLSVYSRNSFRVYSYPSSTSELLRIDDSGSYINGSDFGIGTTNPGAELHVVGRVKTTRIVSSNIILGNIRSNVVGTAYLLLVDLNVTAGFSLAGKVNAASYTTWNVSDIYVRKNYNATTGYATITGISKSGSTLSIVDISHSSGRFIALKLTGDPEVDVMWAGYRLDALFQGSGEVTTLTSGVTENSVYASY